MARAAIAATIVRTERSDPVVPCDGKLAREHFSFLGWRGAADQRERVGARF